MCNSFSVIISNMLFWWSMWFYLQAPILKPWRMGSDLGLHGLLRGFPGPVSWDSCCRRRLWIQGLDCFRPCWKDQEAQCRTCKRKTGDDGHHRNVFPGGDRVLCAYCLFQLTKKRNTAQKLNEWNISTQFQHMWIRKYNFVISHVVFWVSEVLFSPAIFSAHHMFDCLILSQNILRTTARCRQYTCTCLPTRWVAECRGKE